METKLSAKVFSFACAFSFLITAIVIPTTQTNHYKGTMWMGEREALDLVLENDGLGDDFKIVGEGNSVELKYNFYTDDDIEGFYKSGGNWFDKYGAWTFLIFSIFFWIVLILMFANDRFESLRKKAKSGNFQNA